MKKILIAILATVLACVCAVGTTLAYLMDKTAPVKNTFTFGDIKITLTETEGTEISGGKSFKVIPGDTVAKDPVVTVEAGSEACYLFIKVEETNNQIGGEKVVNYTVDTTKWTALNGNPGVYYIEINSLIATDTTYQVLVGSTDNEKGEVLINSDLTKADLATLATNVPTLTFTAYAVQKANVADVATAWSIANS